MAGFTSPYLFLENVEIARRSDNRGSNQVTEDPALDLRFDLFGYMRKPT